MGHPCFDIVYLDTTVSESETLGANPAGGGGVSRAFSAKEFLHERIKKHFFLTIFFFLFLFINCIFIND